MGETGRPSDGAADEERTQYSKPLHRGLLQFDQPRDPNTARGPGRDLVARSRLDLGRGSRAAGAPTMGRWAADLVLRTARSHIDVALDDTPGSDGLPGSGIGSRWSIRSIDGGSDPPAVQRPTRRVSDTQPGGSQVIVGTGRGASLPGEDDHAMATPAIRGSKGETIERSRSRSTSIHLDPPRASETGLPRDRLGVTVTSQPSKHQSQEAWAALGSPTVIRRKS